MGLLYSCVVVAMGFAFICLIEYFDKCITKFIKRRRNK